MGCWGITAFESDEGLDTVEFIRRWRIVERRNILYRINLDCET